MSIFDAPFVHSAHAVVPVIALDDPAAAVARIAEIRGNS